MRRIPLQLKASAATTETENTEAIDVSAFEALILTLVTSSTTGTSPTLNIIVQDSDDGTTWYTHTTIAEITADGTVITRIDKFRKFVRYNMTIGGTTPSFTIVITGLGLNQE